MNSTIAVLIVIAVAVLGFGLVAKRRVRRDELHLDEKEESRRRRR